MIKIGNFIVVLDACVLYQAKTRDLLLRLAEAPAELYQPRWSQQILDEAIQNLINDGRITQQQSINLESCLFEAFEEACVEGYEELIPVLKNNEKDRHVLAAAITCGAQVIITHNIRHYPIDTLKPYNIEAQTPDVFLQHLLDLSPAIIIATFEKQRADLKNPPYSRQKLLDGFAKVVPDFTNKLRDLFASLDSEIDSMLKQEIELFLSLDR